MDDPPDPPSEFDHLYDELDNILVKEALSKPLPNHIRASLQSAQTPPLSAPQLSEKKEHPVTPTTERTGEHTNAPESEIDTKLRDTIGAKIANWTQDEHLIPLRLFDSTTIRNPHLTSFDAILGQLDEIDRGGLLTLYFIKVVSLKGVILSDAQAPLHYIPFYAQSADQNEAILKKELLEPMVQMQALCGGTKNPTLYHNRALLHEIADRLFPHFRIDRSDPFHPKIYALGHKFTVSLQGLIIGDKRIDIPQARGKVENFPPIRFIHSSEISTLSRKSRDRYKAESHAKEKATDVEFSSRYSRALARRALFAYLGRVILAVICGGTLWAFISHRIGWIPACGVGVISLTVYGLGRILFSRQIGKLFIFVPAQEKSPADPKPSRLKRTVTAVQPKAKKQKTKPKPGSPSAEDIEQIIASWG